jgi:hypothetical protein
MDVIEKGETIFIIPSFDLQLDAIHHTNAPTPISFQIWAYEALLLSWHPLAGDIIYHFETVHESVSNVLPIL